MNSGLSTIRRRLSVQKRTTPAIAPHRFHSHEWAVTEETVLDLLKRFQTVNDESLSTPLSGHYPNGWSEEAVRFFLELHPWLYRGPQPQEHHVRFIVTTIRQGDLK